MRKPIWLFTLGVSLLALTGCGPAVTAPAAATVAPPIVAQPSPSMEIPTATPGVQTGGIAGHLTYPGEFIPELRVVAFSVADSKAYSVDTVQNQSTYQILDLPAGSYTVVAYVLDPASKLSAGYSAAVPCGLTIACSDHSLLPVTVAAGRVTQGIDPGDWYARAGSFPPRPGP